MIKLGSHVPFSAPGYLEKAIEISVNNKANCAMIYLGAPQNTKRVAIEKYNLEKYKQKYETIISLKDIIVHAPYIVNPSNPDKQEFAVEFLTQEIERMHKTGLEILVLHPGAFTNHSVDIAINTLISSLNQIFENTKYSNVSIALETMAGKGTEIGIKFEQLLRVIEAVKSPRLSICLDTCHLWDAGYNLKKYDEFKKELVAKDLLKHVSVIHLNDSKNDLGAAKDRHENIDKGFIGLETLAKFVHDKDFDNIPIVLETPIPENGPIYDKEIEMLRKAK
ncbi:endonuclease IV [Mycoplasma testudineum]|uniref:Probable endonuclease 4 n=1 Tax=Mycoplasma testudineum TaxID=244584 RepID=A0A4R6IH01_9MOLU|nr:deoxyribonuclease IV [Mycoplasma testudineum]OYD27080.1 deoxyribonuclease IV [Mycoplasma testudineum]TDO21166.1 endonuclease IV [Mycoplasma testudineum]